MEIAYINIGFYNKDIEEGFLNLIAENQPIVESKRVIKI